MARKSLRPQLNQIRAWVRQGRTDAWIAHQLGVPASQLRDFRHRHGLTAEGAIALGAARALCKPFRRSEMVAAVADLVGPPAA